MKWLQKLFGKKKSIQQAIVEICTEELGTHEIEATNCGPRVNEYKAATNLKPDENWPWCAAFVCWVVREAANRAGVKFTETFRRPTTASAFALELWSMTQDKSTNTKAKPGRDIKAGDIIVFKFSHCGFAASSPDANGFFYAYEGNTNDAGSRDGGSVLKKMRHISKVRCRIRFTV